jgi:hypothetical protein
VRVASIADHSTFSHRLRASVTVSWMMSSTSSWLLRIWCSRWIGEVDTNVCMRGCRACFTASAQRRMSPGMARASPAMTAFFVCLAISVTASKSPSEAIGKPASITSTPISSSSAATCSFSSNVMVAPGDCSPSRNVVSKMMMLSCALLIGFQIPCHRDRKLVPAAYPYASRISIFRLMQILSPEHPPSAIRARQPMIRGK